MKLSPELIGYFRGFISFKLKSTSSYPPGSGLHYTDDIMKDTKMEGKLKIPIHLSSIIDEISNWYKNSNEVDIYVRHKELDVNLIGVYPISVRFCMHDNPDFQNIVLIKFNINNCDFK